MTCRTGMIVLGVQPAMTFEMNNLLEVARKEK
jgi:hypothetical protein